MDMLASPAFWLGLGTIVWVNLLVSGDNAVVIALAARALPPREQRLAVLWGSVGAVLLRVVLTAFAMALLAVPWLRLLGGALLGWIGANLLAPKQGTAAVASHGNVWSAIRVILVADLVMSLDNVIAVAAAAGAAAPTPDLAVMKYVLLVLGLAISVPIVVLGSVFVLGMMNRFPVVVVLGAALLGWIAGDIVVGDPAVSGWISRHLPALLERHLASIAGAILVVAAGLWHRRRQAPAA